MSKLSAQVDRLRELATGYDELQAGAVRVVRISLDTGSILREAADTILSLRDKTQELQAENQKLRELVRDYDKMLEVSIIGYDEPDAPLFDAVRISLRSRMYKLGIEVSE